MCFSITVLDLSLHAWYYKKLFYWGSFYLWNSQGEINGSGNPAMASAGGFLERILRRPSCLGCSWHSQPGCAASSLPCNQLQDQSPRLLDSIFARLSLPVLEMSTAILTSKENQGWFICIGPHSEWAMEQRGSRWPERGREHTVLLQWSGHAPVQAETF